MKQCTKCKIVKDINLFSTHKLTKDGLNSLCRECDNARAKAYSKTKLGLITAIYGHQRKSSTQRGHDMPIYSKKWLTEWLYDQPKFNLLHDEWITSGCKIGLRPSIDRLDDSIGYTINNIQLMTWDENKAKSNKDMRSGKLRHGHNPQKAVRKFTKDGEFIAEYVSVCEASRKTGIHSGNISNCCTGKKHCKSAGGFIWLFKDI